VKIESIRTHRVNVPLEAPYRWAPGHYPGATKTIIEVVTDAGILGLGEVHGAHASRLIDDELGPRLVGLNPLDRHACRRHAVPPLETVAATDARGETLSAFGGVELALWDIAGKVHDAPVHELLGGAVRDKVAFSEYFSMRSRAGSAGGEQSPLAVARYCARMVEEHGSPVFEGKIGYEEASTEVSLVREVRAAIGPDRILRLDANMGWDLATARQMTQRLAAFDIANIEDPVSGLHNMAKLRCHTPIPFSSHTADLRGAIAAGVPDAFVLNLTALGGIEATIGFINACEHTGHAFWFYSGDTGIGTAAYLQVCAALPALRYPNQSLLRWQVDDVVAGGAPQPERGVVDVPTGPGLGVELDRAALARCAARFEREGPIDPFGVDGEGLYRQMPRVPLAYRQASVPGDVGRVDEDSPQTVKRR
jgi:glucarate dehydratase